MKTLLVVCMDFIDKHVACSVYGFYRWTRCL